MKEPKIDLDSFTCPHCKVVAEQNWKSIESREVVISGDDIFLFKTAQCKLCRSLSIWCVLTNKKENNKWVKNDNAVVSAKMVYPNKSFAPEPHELMPEDIIQFYKKASLILHLAPEASCTYLRICLEKLCHKLKEFKGKPKLHKMISTLKDEHIITQNMETAMNSVRLFGNEASHPDQIMIEDNIDLATKLFMILNMIVEHTLAGTARITEIAKITDELKTIKNNSDSSHQ